MLNIVTALRSEARPIIEHLSLKALETHRTPHIYGSETVKLVVSGVGGMKSRVAVERLAKFNVAHNISEPQAWLNIGIAGHRSEKLGSCFIVDKIVEQQSDRNCYPSIPYHTTIESSNLCTVEEPEEDYQENTLYDMEGFSFFSEAQQYSALELIILLKIVSDNQEHPIERINKAMIQRLIENALSSLDEMLMKLQTVIDRNFDSGPKPKIDWHRMWHTTYAQQQILEECCRRLRLLNEGADVLPTIVKCNSAQEAIRVLEDAIGKTPMRLASRQ